MKTMSVKERLLLIIPLLLLFSAVLTYVGIKYSIKGLVLATFLIASENLKANGQELTYSVTEVSLLKREVIIHDVALSSQGNNGSVKINQIVFDQFSYIDFINILTKTQSVFYTARLRIIDANFDLKKVSPAISILLDSLGYANITTNFSFWFHLNPVQRNLEIKNISVEAKDLAQLSLQFALSDITLPTPEMLVQLKDAKPSFSPTKIMELISLFQLDKAILDQFELTYVDKSFLPKVRYSLYQKFKTDVFAQAMAGGYISQLLKSIPAGTQPILSSFKEAFEFFIIKPERLSFRLKPTKKVSVQEAINSGLLNPISLSTDLAPEWEANGKKFIAL